MFFRPLALAVVALLAALCSPPAQAVTIAERSPFTQGHWWNPNRSGSGFELFNVGRDAMAIWYTFDASGNPVWYTAQGEVGTGPWPLLKHRWVDGRRGEFTGVGTLQLTVRAPELADVSFNIGGQAGTWAIQPFDLSGNRNEVDHTGSWFDPANSGWGLTLTQQGDVLGGVLYTYDPSGAPTWYAGFDRGSNGSVAMISARGACPTCSYTATTTQPAGRLTFDFRGESEMVLRSQVPAPMAAGVNVDGARLFQLGRRASDRRADRELASVTGDAQLKAILDIGMQQIQPTGGVDFSASPAPAAFSTTNLQEAGVDEADTVKTDGRLIYTFTSTLSNEISPPSVRVARVSNEGASIEVLGTVPLAASSRGEFANRGLYLHGSSLVAITGTQVYSYSPFGAWYSPYSWLRGVTNIEIFQASANALPVSMWRARIDGHIVSTRRIGDRVYIVARHVPDLPNFRFGAFDDASRASNLQILASTPLAAMLPGVRINGSAPVPIVSANAVYLPPQGTRTAVADMVVIYALDITTGRFTQSLGILGGAEVVYVSPTNLYVATSRMPSRYAGSSLLPEAPFTVTDVHQIRLGADTMTVVGSGTVEGSLTAIPDKAPFRFGEHEGRLRVVTSSNSMWGNDAKNRLTVLEPSTLSPGVLRTVSILPNAQRPESIGKPGELLYGTRFLGDKLYAVTFKKIDPLYVIDIANPADPKIAGALEIPGFSDYLHPLPNGLLLGFGKDARPASGMGDGSFAWYQGLQLTLFDVSSGTPREIERSVIGRRGSNSALLATHHAFSQFTRADGSLAIAIPARVHDGAVPEFGSGDSAQYPWLESGLLRFVVQGNTPATARLVTLPRMVTITPGTGALDPSLSDARAVQFTNGTVYVGFGKFWLQEITRNTAAGPF